MKLLIDCSNIGFGGGLTHMIELVNYIKKKNNRSIEIYILASKKVLDQLPKSKFAKYETHNLLNYGLLKRVFFQFFILDKIYKKKVDIIFSPTGDYIGSIKPLVGMSRNMLFWESDTMFKSKNLKLIIKNFLLRIRQIISFKKSESIFFISNYAKNYVSKKIRISHKNNVVIHHGINSKFLNIKKNNLLYNKGDVYKLLYVSHIIYYKNHLNLLRSIDQINSSSEFKIKVDFVGKTIDKKIVKKIKKLNSKSYNLIENINYGEIEKIYDNYHGLVFASECENMPNTLIEYLASGKPICCSSVEPMPEFLKEEGFYFDVKSISSIKNSLIQMIKYSLKNSNLSKNKIEMAKSYDWDITFDKTFNELIKTYEKFKK